MKAWMVNQRKKLGRQKNSFHKFTIRESRCASKRYSKPTVKQHIMDLMIVKINNLMQCLIEMYVLVSERKKKFISLNIDCGS